MAPDSRIPNPDFLLHPDPDPCFYNKKVDLKNNLEKNANMSSNDLHKAVLWIRIHIRIILVTQIRIRME
jgi:hypothetical protein